MESKTVTLDYEQHDELLKTKKEHRELVNSLETNERVILIKDSIRLNPYPYGQTWVLKNEIEVISSDKKVIKEYLVNALKESSKKNQESSKKNQEYALELQAIKSSWLFSLFLKKKTALRLKKLLNN